MKTLKFILLTTFFALNTVIYAQSAPEAVVKKAKAMQEQITKDLKLTPEQSTTYFDCAIDRYTMLTEKMSPTLTPEEKAEVRKEINGNIREKMSKVFPWEMIRKVNEWNAANDKNFNTLK